MPQTKTSKSTDSGWKGLGLMAAFVIVMFSLFRWSPGDYFFEASGSAYYQARVAYQRGSAHERAAIVQAFRDGFRDGRISMRDYSTRVFPAYLNTVHDGEVVFPAAERAKPIEQLRSELTSIVGAGPAR